MKKGVGPALITLDFITCNQYKLATNGTYYF